MIFVLLCNGVVYIVFVLELLLCGREAKQSESG